VKRRHTKTLTIALGDELPSAFRIFRAGQNDSTKGSVLFDEQAAKQVLATFEAQGVDLMIDLNHSSLEPESRAYDPDARGWAKLVVKDGELWAVDVKWTPDGALRLREKRQRYVSPAFFVDDDGRVVEMINVALVAMPATHNAQPLVAAQRFSMLDPETVKKALEAIKNGDSDAALALLEGMVAEAAGGGEEPPAEEPPAEMADEPPVEEELADDPEEEDEDKPAAMAAATRLCRMTGKATFGAAVDEVEVWRQSHLALETERTKLAKERAALESSERRKLVGDLVKLGVELPATAWKDSKGSVPCKRLQDEPIAELRNRVAVLSKARGGKGGGQSGAPQAPALATGDGGKVFHVQGEQVELSARDLSLCKEMGAKPEVFAANKLARQRAKRS
jgi:hypothetical protein